MRSKRELLVLLAVVSLLCCPAVASAVNASKDDEPVVMSEAQKKLQTIVEAVRFKDTPIDDALSFLAENAGVDIVKSPQVTGTVTATINNAPLGEVLDNILALNGAGYVATNRVIRVVPRAEMELQKEQRLHKVYRVSYADVRQVADALKTFVSKDAEVGVNLGTGNIIITDTETKLKAIDAFMEEIDRPIPQILVEVRIYDIVSQGALDLGVNWSIGTSTSFDADTGAPVGGHTAPFVSGQNAGTSEIGSGQSSIRFGWLNSSVDIDVLIKAQQEDISATLLANPRILVLDNETAHFKSVEEIPYQELQQSSAGGSIGTTAFKEVGVALEVTPHVARDNMLRMHIIPEFSTSTRNVNVAAAGLNVAYPQPVIDKRTANTTLLIEDGRTIVLGGLRKKESKQRVNKVPLLGDLPILGAFFRNTSENIVTRELVVFLTPRVVSQLPLTAKEEEQLDYTDEQLSVSPVIQDRILEGGTITGHPRE